MINPDLPITKSSEDTLNRTSFAKSRAKTISQYSLKSSFTIGLYGEWGSGKMSLVRHCFEKIGTDGGKLISKDDKPLYSFLRLC